jgi:hypothetical protein
MIRNATPDPPAERDQEIDLLARRVRELKEALRYFTGATYTGLETPEFFEALNRARALIGGGSHE